MRRLQNKVPVYIGHLKRTGFRSKYPKERKMEKLFQLLIHEVNQIYIITCHAHLYLLCTFTVNISFNTHRLFFQSTALLTPNQYSIFTEFQR